MRSIYLLITGIDQPYSSIISIWFILSADFWEILQILSDSVNSPMEMSSAMGVRVWKLGILSWRTVYSWLQITIHVVLSSSHEIKQTLLWSIKSSIQKVRNQHHQQNLWLSYTGSSYFSEKFMFNCYMYLIESKV